MPRPRVYDLDTVLDAVETLVVQSDPAAVTIRAVSVAVGISNGALYHWFGSRAGLIGQAWLRAGFRFLTLQRALLEAALSSEDNDAVGAVVAAANAPAIFAQQHPGSAQLILTLDRADVLTSEVPTDIADQLKDLDKLLLAVLIELSTAMWGRRDAAAVDVITTCVVDLPTAILLRRNRLDLAIAREHLNAAVAGILSVGPPEGRRQAKSR